MATEPVAATVTEFATKRGVESALELGMQLVTDCFPDAERVRAEMGGDPETGKRWIAIEFDTRGTPEEILDWHDRLTRTWVRTTDGTARESICFSFDILEQASRALPPT